MAIGSRFFFKQSRGVRKKSMGRQAHGRTYDEMPRVSACAARLHAVTTIDFHRRRVRRSDVAAIRRTIETDRVPHAPRLVPMPTALAKLGEAAALGANPAGPAAEGRAGSQSRQAGAAITGAYARPG